MPATRKMAWPLIRYNNFAAAILAFFLLTAYSSKAQGEDLYNLENSRKFARHLLLAQDYELAALELERLHFMQPQNDSVKLMLLRSYRLSQQSEKGLQRFRDFYFGFPPDAPVSLTQEYYRMLLRVKNYGLARKLLDSYSRFSDDFTRPRQAALLLVNKQYDSSATYARHNQINDPVLLSLINRGRELPRKSPFWSGVLSTLVPGLGKVYTGNWQDGLVAFIFVGANAYGAYRGFSARGVESGYGWFFASLGSAFYVSNIYGSAKAAHRYNQIHEDDFTADVEKYLYLAD